MLILTRRIGESLVIGDCVTVTVRSVKGGQVRIGIAGPPEIPVRRGELANRIRVASAKGFRGDVADAQAQVRKAAVRKCGRL